MLPPVPQPHSKKPESIKSAATKGAPADRTFCTFNLVGLLITETGRRIHNQESQAQDGDQVVVGVLILHFGAVLHLSPLCVNREVTVLTS